MKCDYTTRVIQRYGDKYDLSKLKFEGLDKPVTVICREHGQFTVNAFDFLYRKHGCPDCRKKGRPKNFGRSLTTKEALTRAFKVWGNRWDYSKFKYSGHRNKVTIICREHGEFEQDIYNHLKGHIGCRKCRYGASQQFTRFLLKAKNRYGDKYDYSQVTYLGFGTPIKVCCPQHGPFLVTPAQHTRGAECPLCKPRLKRKYRRRRDITNKHITPQELELIREAVVEYVQERKAVQ